MSASRRPLASALLPGLDYLAAYPYGSTDATVSAFLPDLALAAPGQSLPSERPGPRKTA